MDRYLTPRKENVPKQLHSQSNNRLNDWVCVICNNLNFSFRKKCNRCKTQTRYQNQLATAYSQYYYEQIPQPILHYRQNQTPLQEYTNSYMLVTQKSSINRNRQYDSIEKRKQKKQIHTTAAISDGTIEQNRKDVFSCDMWKDLEVLDFQEICQEKQEQDLSNGHVFNDGELENLINKILL